MKTWIKSPLALLSSNDVETTTESNGVVIKDDKISEVLEPGAEPSSPVDEVFDASGLVVLPGLINTHHHYYQTLTRSHPDAINKGLFSWLKSLYPVWANLQPEMIEASTRLACAELLLSGCTASCDHHYLFTDAIKEAMDIQVEATTQSGIRSVITRGSMSLSEKDGGLPPDRTVQSEDVILEDITNTQEIV